MIKILCNKAHAGLCSYLPVLTAGMAKAEKIQFVFSRDWNGLCKTAVFTDGLTTIDVLEASWAENVVTIPAEVMTTAGRVVRVGIYGTTADGMALPTIWANLGKVQPGADPSGDEATEPTLPIWSQLLTQIGDLSDLTTLAKSNLVAAINEAARTGSGGTAFDLGPTLRLDGNTLSVNTTDAAEQDNTLPITSAGVYKEVGNINALLATI